MNNKYPNFLNASLFAVALALFTGSLAFAASPADEIGRAVSVAGGADVKQAAPAQFLQGFRAVVIKVSQADAPLYVSSAARMRPDLAPQITVAALTARPLDQRNCRGFEAIIRAAITTTPTARHAIGQAAWAAQPAARDCIFAAAFFSEAEIKLAYARRSDGKDISDGKQLSEGNVSDPATFPPPTIWDVGNIISINPGPGGFFVVSPSDSNDL